MQRAQSLQCLWACTPQCNSEAGQSARTELLAQCHHKPKPCFDLFLVEVTPKSKPAVAAAACDCRYELHLRSIRMLDFYGGPHILTPEEYFAADLKPQQPAQQPPQQHTVSLPRRWAGRHQQQPATQEWL